MIEHIRALASNYRWSWHSPTLSLFERADAAGLSEANGNPYTWLKTVGTHQAATLFETAGLTAALAEQAAELEAYLDQPPIDAPPVAYFCMEYGLHESLAIYSGGLGILAGDHVKEASDSRLDFVALGFLYTDGYLRQSFDAMGRQVSGTAGLDRAEHALTKLDETVSVGTPEGTLHADVYLLQVGRSRLYLLDPAVDRNEAEALRTLCSRLYGGDRLTRIRQEVLLGVGGMRLLEQLGESGRVLHMNEGHCAFALCEAVRLETETAGGRALATQSIRARSVFTTHTPVPAGHDRFGAELAMAHVDAAWEDDDFTAWVALQGREKGCEHGSICMTVLALNLAERTNGVAEIHGHVSRAQWPGYVIGHVTNGVHVPTWVADEILDLDEGGDLREARNVLRRRLVEGVRERLEAVPADCRSGNPDTLRDDILTIGFARRFAPYKRAGLIFSDPERLAAILTNPDMPVQLIYAGKAHPADTNGKALVKMVFEAARNPLFEGRIHLVPDYDMEMGRLMVSGADVWLNNPRRPLEASGTSGQKAAMNGCLNLSVPDGWWPEGYDGTNGWAIGPEVHTDAPAEVQDALDMESLYTLLEDMVVPLFYGNSETLPSPGWLARAQHSIDSLTWQFSAQRMLEDYIERCYKPSAPAPAPDE